MLQIIPWASSNKWPKNWHMQRPKLPSLGNFGETTNSFLGKLRRWKVFTLGSLKPQKPPSIQAVNGRVFVVSFKRTPIAFEKKKGMEALAKEIVWNFTRSSCPAKDQEHLPTATPESLCLWGLVLHLGGWTKNALPHHKSKRCTLELPCF